MPGSALGMSRSSMRRTAVAVIHQLGHGVGEAPGADVMEHEDRVGPPPSGRTRAAGLDDLLGAPLDFRIARWTEAKSRSAELVPLPTDDAAPPPRPISIAGPPRTMSSAPTGGPPPSPRRHRNVAEPAGQHDRLVVAAGQAGLPDASACSKLRK